MKSLKSKFAKFFALLFIIQVIVSCSDDFLKPRPLSEFIAENAYINKNGLIALLNDCRSNFKNQYRSVGGDLNLNWMFRGEMTQSDIAMFYDRNNEASFLRDLDMQLTPENAPSAPIFTLWQFNWQFLKSAGTVITRAERAKLNSEEERNEILAEGYFHRAFWYYRLVHEFGDVPFIDGELTSPKVDFYSYSRKSILKRLVKDMEFAVQWLPRSVPYGAVNRAAGYHLLAKLYLSTGQFDEAVQAATEVIENSGLMLMTERFGIGKSNPAEADRYRAFPTPKVFKDKNGRDSVGIKYTPYTGDVMWDLFHKENISNPENKEGILVVQNRYAFDGNGSIDANIANRVCTPFWLAIPGMYRAVGDGGLFNFLYRGQGFSVITPYFAYDLWKDCGGDLRRKWPNWFVSDSLYYNDPNNADYGKRVPKPTTSDTTHVWGSYPRYKIFHFDEKRNLDTDPGLLDPRGGYSDRYIFRLAETYLMRAEAYWWKNDLAKAAADVNAVRSRAQAPEINASDVTIDYIFDERARELYTEEARKSEITRVAFVMADQKRDGYTEDMLAKNWCHDRILRGNVFYREQILLHSIKWKISPYHYLWPIPQSAINANVEGHINQNMGYFGSEKNIPLLELE